MSDTLYKYANIFYKKEDAPGWIPAIMAGDEKSVKAKANELKIKNNWFDVQIFPGGARRMPVPDFENIELEPRETQLISNWVYSCELSKWFLDEDEIIPVPHSQCEVSNDLTVIYGFQEDMNDDLSDTTEEDLYPIIDVKIKTLNQLASGPIELHFPKGYIKKFIDKIKAGKYACIDLGDFASAKILIWTIGNKIRFKVQSYYEDYTVSEPMDVLVDRDAFISKLDKTIQGINNETKELLANPKDYVFKNKEI